jgi:hypothetical protein
VAESLSDQGGTLHRGSIQVPGVGKIDAITLVTLPTSRWVARSSRAVEAQLLGAIAAYDIPIPRAIGVLPAIDLW